MPDFSEMKKALDSYEEKIRKDKASLKEQEEELRKKKDRMEADMAAKEAQSRARIDAEKKTMMEELKECRAKVEAEKRDWEEEKERVKQTKVFEKVITLNVGGTRYTTTLSTLTKYPDSMLGAMFSGRHNLPQQEDGSYFIDRDGEVFKYILMYLRDSTVAYVQISQQEKTQQLLVKIEANYYLLPELEEVLQRGMDLQAAVKEKELRKSIVEQAPKRAHSSHLVEYQGLRAPQFALDYELKRTTKCQYYYIDRQEEILEQVKYGQKVKDTMFTEHVIFHNCDLSGAEFHCCIFEKPVSFEGSILRNTVFENVSGLVTHRDHFTPRQVTQAKFQPELLDALRANGCIY